MLKKLEEWVADPDDPTLLRKFGRWSIGELTEWKKRKMRSALSKQGSRHAKLGGEGKSKRAHHATDSESDDELASTSTRPTKKSKKRAISPIELDSDALDVSD